MVKKIILCIISVTFSCLSIKAECIKAIHLSAKNVNGDNILSIKKTLIDKDTTLTTTKHLPDSVSHKPIYLSDLDTLSIVASKSDIHTTNKWVPNSKTAMLWGLIPGGGQIYNRKYWKLPIVMGAFTTCFYAIRFNQRKFDEYHSAYRSLSSADPSKDTAWMAFTPAGTKPTDWPQYKYLLDPFKRGNDYFNRWRDISIVSTIAVYALSILDAYVDAELATFDISPNLSMKLYPKLINSIPNTPEYRLALGCTIQF